MNPDPVFDYTDLGGAPRSGAATGKVADVVAGVRCMQAPVLGNVASGVESVPGPEKPFAGGSEPAHPFVQGRRRRPAVIRWGRVRFDCPVCSYHTVLMVEQCGAAVRCRKCYSGIQVPDPRRKLASKNLNQSIESVLRPDGFVPCEDVSRFVPWVSSLLPGFGQFAFGGGVALILLGMIAVVWVTLKWAKNDRTAHMEPVAALPVQPDVKAVSAQAESAVRQFLDAATIDEKAAYVTHPQETAPLMTNWYARMPGAGSQPNAILREPTVGFYPNPGEIFGITKVPVEMPGSPVITYLVQHHKVDGARIDWAESVAYSPISWQNLVKQVGLKKPVRMRLLACLDDYYNFRWKDEARYRCVRFHEPHTKARLGYGYMLRSEGKTLARLLPPAQKSVLRPVTVDLLPDADSSNTQQVEIVGGVFPGWKVQPIAEQSGITEIQGAASSLQASGGR